MSTTAPKPPTKRLFAAACLTGGTTVGILAITVVGHFVYDGIPANRLPVYSAAMVGGTCTAAFLAVRYLIQKCRSDAWRAGKAACEESPTEEAPLDVIKAELEELAEAVFDLADAAGRPRPAIRATASTYTSRAAQDDTVPLNRRTVDADTDVQVQLADRKQVDPEAEARAQGYAEGYVDGIARRREAEGAAD